MLSRHVATLEAVRGCRAVGRPVNTIILPVGVDLSSINNDGSDEDGDHDSSVSYSEGRDSHGSTSLSSDSEYIEKQRRQQ